MCEGSEPARVVWIDRYGSTQHHATRGHAAKGELPGIRAASAEPRPLRTLQTLRPLRATQWLLRRCGWNLGLRSGQTYSRPLWVQKSALNAWFEEIARSSSLPGSNRPALVSYCVRRVSLSAYLTRRSGTACGWCFASVPAVPPPRRHPAH